jgi:hypothetical protein
MRTSKRIGIEGAVWLLLALLVAASGAWAATTKNRDLVVVGHERWLDTLKGTVKNFSKAPARDVTVVVKFYDKKKKPLGVQRVGVGDLRSGDQSDWSLAIAEKNRPATKYEFQLHAIWP